MPKKVFDFSALRRFLFEKGIAPATAIIYTPQKPVSKSTIFYGAPKLTHLARRFAAIVIETNDLKQLPLGQVLESIDSMRSVNNKENEALVKQATIFNSEIDEEDEEETYNRAINIWKVALWGTSYDYILLQALNDYPSLLEVINERGWQSGSGFIRTGSDVPQYCVWLDKAPFLDAKHFTRYGIDLNQLSTLPENALYHRGRKQSIFEAPLVLFKRGQTQRRPGAAYIDQKCTYTNAITGITGPEQDRNLLKALTALLNSELAQYYLFLTSSSWGVEREEVTAGEMRTIPFPFLDARNDQLVTIANLVDKLAQYTLAQQNTRVKKVSRNSKKRDYILEELERELNDYIFECFHLNEQEIQHIRATVQFTIDFFNSPEKSLALQRPTVEMLQSYVETYIRLINFYLEPVGKKLTATVYVAEKSPLHTIRFSSRLLSEDVPNIDLSLPNDYMRRALSELNKLSNERVSQRMYHRRNFRIYNNNEDALYIVKPSEQRQWTVSAALKDAEETVAELTQPIRV